MQNRSYNQFCGLAYALDIVGERWTLLILRELLPGPRRFKDLIDGLPGISTNLLAERLKSLEQQGMLRRRVLPPPAGSTVYELTELAQGLEPMMIELGKWGSQFAPPTPEGATVLRPGSYLLTTKTFFRPERARDVDQTYALHIDNEVLMVHISKGEIRIWQGQETNADLVVHTTIGAYLALLRRQIQPRDALAQGLVQIEGDLATLEQFLDICGMSQAAEENRIAA